MSLRKYLVIFMFPTMKKENAWVKDALESHSGGDFKMVFTYGIKEQPSIVGFFFTTSKPHFEIRFGNSVLNEDSYLLVEVGDRCSEQNLNVAYQWMQSHKSQTHD